MNDQNCSGTSWALHHGPAHEIIATLGRDSISGVFTDPPYADVSSEASFVTTRKGVVREGQFFESWVREQLSLWMTVLKPDGVVWFTIDWFGAMQVDAACGRLGLRRPSVGVWDRGGLGMGHVMRHTYECFVVIPMERWQPISHSIPDVWRIKWTPSDRSHKHSAEKPVELFSEAMKSFVAPGGTLLDPFAGTGSSGLAAVRHGSRWIGIEREAEYCEIATSRLATLDGRHMVRSPNQAVLFGGNND